MTKRISKKRAAYNIFLAVFVVIALISMGISFQEIINRKKEAKS